MSRHVGRVKLHRGVASVDDGPDPTAAMPARPQPAPVFVDDSGQRRRRVRRVILWLGAMVLVIVAAVWWSQSADPVRPDPVRTCAPAPAKCANR